MEFLRTYVIKLLTNWIGLVLSAQFANWSPIPAINNLQHILNTVSYMSRLDLYTNRDKVYHADKNLQEDIT